MANRLGVAMQRKIIQLHLYGLSNRKIAQDLEINRKTVDLYVKKYKQIVQNGPNLTTGSVQNGPNPATGFVDVPDDIKRTTNPSHSGSKRMVSLCEPHREFIENGCQKGLSATRIYQDLLTQTSFKGKYNSVKRFVAKLKHKQPQTFRRIETAPGQEMQIDFGKGAHILVNGKKKRPWLLRVVLSFSRKAYSEVVWKQNTENVIRVLERAFRYLGGVPRKLVPDNMKSAVIKADWYDPDLNPKAEAFAQYYGFVILPTKPGVPRHKGKIERAVDYVQDNALKGRVFDSLEEQNMYLRYWEKNIADTRIHGTTRKQVKMLFDQEKPSLLSLPSDPFPCYDEKKLSVHIDGHIALNYAYYSVPYEYTRQKVWARWNSSIVRIYDSKEKLLAVHIRKNPGRFSTDKKHCDPKKISQLELGTHYLVDKAAKMGPACKAWSQQVLKYRKEQGLRVVLGLTSLSGKYSCRELNTACATALSLNQWRLKNIRHYLKNKEFPHARQLFTQQHELIRSIKEYDREVQRKTHNNTQEDTNHYE